MLKKIMGPKTCLLVIYHIIRFNRHTLVLIGNEYCFQAFKMGLQIVCEHKLVILYRNIDFQALFYLAILTE